MTVGATQLNVKKCIKPRKIETDHTDHGENQFVSTVERTQMKEIIFIWLLITDIMLTLVCRSLGNWSIFIFIFIPHCLSLPLAICRYYYISLLVSFLTGK